MYASLDLYVAIPTTRTVFFRETGETVNRCGNGHIGVLDAKFCQECGQKYQEEVREEHTELFTEICAKQGWETPAAGFKALLDKGWLAKCDGTQESSDIYRIVLTPINVEAVHPDTENPPQVFGLAIKIGHTDGLGEGCFTNKVLEIPLDGFPRETAALKGVAAILGIDGQPALYPQVSLE